MNEAIVLDSLLNSIVQVVASANMPVEARISIYDCVIDYLLDQRKEFVRQISEDE